MNIHGSGKTLSEYLHRVEILGLNRFHLMILDLPELIHSETKQQSALDTEMVQSIVQSYMKEPQRIILVVISAKI